MNQPLKKALVIGSGIAGIASAIRLKALGYEVEVFEANSYTGGKLHVVKSDGYRWDAGPSLFTMPHLVDELFTLMGENPKEYFDYNRHSTVCNYFWDDGTRFNVPSDESQFVKEAANKFDSTEKAIEDYLSNAKAKYDLSAPVFLEKSLHKLSTYTNSRTVHSLINSFRLDVFSSLDKVNRKAFKNKKLVQLFNRYATYNGSSPYSTPGIMSMIPHLEMHYGTFLPKGGMHEISQSLTRFAKKVGVKFHLSTPVTGIIHEEDRALGIKTETKDIHGDVVMCNMDVFSAYQSLLDDVKKPKRTLKQERSSSALIFYWGVKREFQELDLHNILFSEDYETEFDYLFNKLDLFDDPTVYINITSKLEPSDAPEGCENWFVMVNAPGNFEQDWDALIEKGRKNIINKINKVLGTDISKYIETESILDPRSIEKKTSSHRGSLYGASSNSMFAAFLRHPNFSSTIKNLYFCGGSAHPGGGIPLCLLSAKIATDAVPKVSA